MNHLNPVVRYPTSEGCVWIARRSDLQSLAAWRQALADQRKDYRYYELLEETIIQGFDYRYFVVEDGVGRVRAVQPFFFLQQDILQGSGDRLLSAAGKVRRVFPRFLTLRTLMVGCAAGEGHLDRGKEAEAKWVARQIHDMLKRYAKRSRASMVVLKEFPSTYRATLRPFSSNGYTRVPSLPSVKIHLPFKDFDDYMAKSLSKATRKDLRRKFRDTDGLGITMEVLTDLTPFVDELYPLYLQVYERSDLRFEKLTKPFLCKLGQTMPDKARFFVWRKDGKAIAFSVCMIVGDELHDEYVGLDYSVALDLHLYFCTLRDVFQWMMQNGFVWYCSSAMGYEPKLRLKAKLAPLDLYVAHTSGIFNQVLKRVLPLLEPTRSDKTLREFPNFDELWGKA